MCRVCFGLSAWPVAIAWMLLASMSILGQAAERVLSAASGATPPRWLAVGQTLSEGDDSLWAAVEGNVVAVSEDAEGVELDLRSGNGQMRVRVTEGRSVSTTLILNSRIQAVGICQSAWTLDGQKVAGLLTLTDYSALKQLEVAPELWAAHPMIKISDLWRTDFPKTEERLVHVGGRIVSAQTGRSLVLADATGEVTVHTTQPLPHPTDGIVEILGRWSRMGTNVVLSCGFCREMAGGAIGGAAPPTVLSTAGQIKRLKREEALRGYPARIRGVITCVQPKFRALVIQDSTLGIYVKTCPYTDSDPPHVGEYWEVEGVTDAGFAPMIQPRRAVRIGLGVLPEPVRPTRDQLMNGSLDTQYVELQGIVTAVKPSDMALLTRAGQILVRLPGYKPQALKPFEDSLVSLRGCLFARHGSEDVSLHFKLGEIEIHNARIKVDESAPTNLFATPPRRAADLLLFDPDAGAFQRVKVMGQIVQMRQGLGYLMDGDTGLRFAPKLGGGVAVADLVEVVGFPELGEPSPLLHEAVVRKVGRAPLRPPTQLAPEDLFNDKHDSTRVQIEALLVSLSRRRTEQVLELQVGVRKFLARLDGPPDTLAPLPLGSRLQLTGVYAGQGSRQIDSHDLTTFELLLSSAGDIRVLAQPPWWTLGRMFAVVGALGGVLVFASIYITLLHRQVEQRTVQLKREIHDREHAEHQQALEEERSRIARDLHDDLGSTLTEISMLAETGRDQPAANGEAPNRFERILARASSLVRTLDEIVWAVDPRKDTLPALARYLAGFAEEYLSAAGLTCRVELPAAISERPLAARERHELFLGVKEALNNVLKHSQASQVLFRIDIGATELLITISDNGQGFDTAGCYSGNGVANLRQRLAAVQGRCEINSRAGDGTTVLLALSLSRSSTSL